MRSAKPACIRLSVCPLVPLVSSSLVRRENHQQLTANQNWDADVVENASGFLTPNTAHDLGDEWWKVIWTTSDLANLWLIPSSRPIPSLEARLPFAAILGGPEPFLNSKLWQQLQLKNGYHHKTMILSEIPIQIPQQINGSPTVIPLFPPPDPWWEVFWPAGVTAAPRAKKPWHENSMDQMDQMDQRKTERKLQHDPDLTSRSMLLYSLAHLMLDDVRCQSPSNRSKLQRDPRPPKKRQVQLGRVQPLVVFPSQGRHPKSFKTLL